MCKIGAFMTLVTPSGGIKNTKPGNNENNWVESTSLHLFFSRYSRLGVCSWWFPMEERWVSINKERGFDLLCMKSIFCYDLTLYKSNDLT